MCRATPSPLPPPLPPPPPPGGAVLGGLVWRGLARHTHSSPGGSSPRCSHQETALARGQEPCICGDEPWPLCGSAVSTYSTQAAAAFAAADPWVLRRRVLWMERILPRLGEVDEVLRRHADLNRENAHKVGVRSVLRARRTCYVCARLRGMPKILSLSHTHARARARAHTLTLMMELHLSRSFLSRSTSSASLIRPAAAATPFTASTHSCRPPFDRFNFFPPSVLARR